MILKCHAPLLRVARLRALLVFAPLAASLASAQEKPADSTPSESATTPWRAASAPPAPDSTLASNEEPINLSPFEVQATTSGYMASNTMSGTRLNTKLEDLAASISVVTRQQIEDFALVDINDVFLYEANTEGMQQYTEFTIDRSFYVENTTLNPQSANRIRGIGSANTSINNFAMTGSVPIDSYNVGAIEISRGPNANIFGLGNAAGTVNVVIDDANVTRNQNRIQTRADSYGGWRASANLNRVLKKDRAAIHVALLRDEKGFERDPAYENINRVFVSTTLKPFRNTTIRAAYESYHNHFSRANTTLPRDSITEWMASGMPVWNPSYTTGGATGAWRLLNSSTYTPVTTANETAGLPTSLLPGSLNSGIWTSPAVAIEPDGRVTFYGMGSAGSSATTPVPAGTPTFRLVETASVYRRARSASGVPLVLFQTPSITDKSIYDWEELNFLSPNYGRDKADTYRVEINHNFIANARHFLGARAGQFREVIDRYDHAVFSRSDSAVPYLHVDVNETLIDGTPNPNFLRPYIGGSQPTTRYTDERSTSSRAELAYQLDLTGESGWLKWAGRHLVNIYAERRDILTTSLTARDLNVNDYTWTSANDRLSIPLRGNTYRIFPRYYLGGPVTEAGPIIDQAPARTFNLGSTPFTSFNSARTRSQEPASIQEIITSGNSRDREIRSKGVVWQGSFWNDRIVPTLGWRADRNRERSSRNLNANPLSPTQPSSTVNPGTRLHDLSFVNLFPNPWEEKQGQSRQQGVVVKATRWLNFNYNQSNGFKPETLAYNINGELLPNPVGKTKDYGVTLKLLDDKLVARITRYETVERNSRNGSITSAAVTRTLRLLFDPSSSNAITGTNTLSPPLSTLPNGSDAFDLEQNATQWILWENPSYTIDQARQAAMDTYLKPLGITEADITRVRTLGASAFTDINTVTSTGTEFELTYNPTRYWTMKLTGAQQKAVDTELGTAVNDYINGRLAAIQSIVVPDNPGTRANNTAGRFWWTTGQSATSTNSPAAFYIANVKSVIGLATANAGKPRAQTREYRVNFTTNYKLAGLFGDSWLKEASVGGALRWASKAALSYYGGPPAAEYGGAIIDYDANRPIYDDARAEFDFNAAYNLRLWNDKVRCKLQLNVKNAFEGGRLQPIAYNPDGLAWNYRIIDPRQFILTATFDF
jgi:hypothetical protein